MVGGGWKTLGRWGRLTEGRLDTAADATALGTGVAAASVRGLSAARSWENTWPPQQRWPAARSPASWAQQACSSAAAGAVGHGQ